MLKGCVRVRVLVRSCVFLLVLHLLPTQCNHRKTWSCYMKNLMLTRSGSMARRISLQLNSNAVLRFVTCLHHKQADMKQHRSFLSAHAVQTEM